MKAALGLMLAMIGEVVIGATAINHLNAQSSSGFEKRNFSYNEWTKGKFSEVVTVTNPGKFIFLAGIGPEREGDGKIVHEGDFMEQCRYAYMKIKKLLDLQGATMNDVVRIMTYTTDVRFFQDALKCREKPSGTLRFLLRHSWWSASWRGPTWQSKLTSRRCLPSDRASHSN